MRFQKGDTFTAAGCNPAFPTLQFRVDSILAVGGQGFGYGVREEHHGWPAFAKTFLPQYVNDATSERTRWLCRQGIDHPGLLVPRYLIEDGGQVVGHVAPIVEGTGLHDAIFPEDGSSGPELLERLALAREISRTLATLHGRGIAHGDLSGGNVLLTPGHAVHLIDFDNYAAAGAPPPSMQGTPRYMAPSVLTGTPPSPASDVFSALILAHELLLGRHPFIPPDVPADELGKRMQEAMMRAARWLDDPTICKTGHAERGGAPVRWLPPGLIHLFRGAFSRNEHPTADGLAGLLDGITVRPCSACGLQALHDGAGGNPHCPWCRGPLQRTLRLSWGRNSLSLPEGTYVIGRREIDLPEVSREHFRLVISGDRVTVEDLSRHGTWMGRWRVPHAPYALRLPAYLHVGTIRIDFQWV